MTTEDWVDALSIISDGLPSVTEGCRLPVRMRQQIEMAADSGKNHTSESEKIFLQKYLFVVCLSVF